MAMGVDVHSAGILEVLEESAQSAVEPIGEQATQASVSAVETAIEHGNPYRGICSYVEDHDIDLVVIGTRGRSGIERYLLGSVTEKTVRTSPVTRDDGLIARVALEGSRSGSQDRTSERRIPIDAVLACL